MRSQWITKGMKEYLEDIAKAGVDIDPAADRAVMAAADVLHPEMVQLAPVGDVSEGDEHPGNLKRNIIIEGPFQDGNLHYSQIGVSSADPETVTYAAVQELGSPSKHIPAQSYVRAAQTNKQSAARKAMKDSLAAEGLINP